MSTMVTSLLHCQEVNSVKYPPAVRIVSSDSYILAAQSVVDSDSKIASHLDPVLILIGPNPEVKADCAGAEVNNVGLGRRFLRNSGLIGSDPLQYINHLLRRCASSNGDGHFDRSVPVR